MSAMRRGSNMEDRIAPSDGPDEFVELRGEQRVHRVATERRWLLRGARFLRAANLGISVRALEKKLELLLLWRGARSFVQHAEVRSVDLVCCTYNRLDEPLRSIPSMLAEAAAARALGLFVTLRVVSQKDDFAMKLFASRPEWREQLVVSPSFPPSLPRARNVAVASSRADLIVFV